MALDPATSLVIFVPGIMGSVLRYRGPDRHGNATEEILWGTDGLGNLDILSRTPEKMRAPGYAHSVIRSVITAGSGQTDIYGGLISFCLSKSGLGLSDGVTFYAFPYDWRNDNALSAAELAMRIGSLDPAGEKHLYLIAHSMGGLVCRVMINRHPEIARRVVSYFRSHRPLRARQRPFGPLTSIPSSHPSSIFFISESTSSTPIDGRNSWSRSRASRQCSSFYLHSTSMHSLGQVAQSILRCIRTLGQSRYRAN